MASVWLQERGMKEARKIRGRLSERTAINIFEAMYLSWQGEKLRVFDYEALLYQTDEQYRSRQPAGVLYVEFCSPPSGPEVGQPRAQERKAHD